MTGVRRPPLDTARLATGSAWPVEVLPSAGSTNALLVRRALAGEGPQVLVTEHQVAGRGRRDRGWLTPARAALTLSVLLRPRADAGHWPWLPLLVGLAVVETLPAGPGIPAAALKWPNDVLLDGRKVAGILVERVESPAQPAAVVGVGLNVSTTPEELPVPTATSLAIAGIDADRTELLVALLQRLRTRYDAWSAGPGRDSSDGGELRAAYTARCATLGHRVRVDLPGGRTLIGRATGIDAAGRLLVDPGEGEVVVSAGDVVHVRAER